MLFYRLAGGHLIYFYSYSTKLQSILSPHKLVKFPNLQLGTLLISSKLVVNAFLVTVLADSNFTLITNPYVNEVTLRRQELPLKCC